jgi:hypothetical protein
MNKMKYWSTSSLTMPISMEDTKKMLGTYNKMLSKSTLPW